MQAIILAGGKGTRLAERLNGKPKPLIEVCGEPLLSRQIKSLVASGVDEVVLLVNHAADQIEAFLDGQDFGCRITLIDDGEPRGTAGATLACLDQLADSFLVVYGDTLFDIDIRRMIDEHARSGAAATLLLHPNDHPADSDLVEIDEDGRISAFHSYPHPAGAALRNLVNAAFYVVERRALESWRDRTDLPDFAKHLFPAMVTAGSHLHGYISFEYIKDLGTPKRLDKVERHLASGVVHRSRRSEKQQAVFVDRDGTLNELRGFINAPEQLQLMAGAATAVRMFNDAEYRVIVITNQPVLARGECDQATMRAIHAKLESELGASNAFLDGIYYCPHHPHSGYPGEVADLKIACDCRKPAPGLVNRATEDFNIDAARSWFIGDSTADIALANSLGLLSVLVDTGERGRDGKYCATPDFMVTDIGAAARLVTELYPRLRATIDAELQGFDGDRVIVLTGEIWAQRAVATALRRRFLVQMGSDALIGRDDVSGTRISGDVYRMDADLIWGMAGFEVKAGTPVAADEDRIS